MKTPDDIKKGLECCIVGECSKCPYMHECDDHLTEGGDMLPADVVLADMLSLIQQLESEKWELFDLLSSAWYGKQTYFKQEDGTVYSRMSGEYLSFDQAIDAFACRLTPIEGVE